MPADQGLIDSVANANTKTITESGAYSVAQVFNAQALAAQDYGAHRARLNILAEAELANNLAIGRSVVAQVVKAIAESDLSEALAQLGAALNSQQIQNKTAQTTPPETGKTT